MRPYFESACNWEKYEKILMSWVGTPYRHFTAVKERGADCALFFAESMVEMNLLSKWEVGWYPKDWFRHTSNEFVVETIFDNFMNYMPEGVQLNWLPKETPLMRGDIPAFCTIGKGATNHCAIMLEGNRFINSVEHGGVQILTWGSWWKRRLRSIFRVMEV